MLPKVTPENRIKIVYYYTELNLSIRSISKKLDIPRTTVHRWINRWEEEKTIDAKQTKKRRRKLGEEDAELIEKLVQADRSVSGKQLKEELYTIGNVRVNEATIYRELHRIGFNYTKERPIPAFSSFHMISREMWAGAHKDWKEEWKRVVFSDESTVMLGPNRRESKLVSDMNALHGAENWWLQQDNATCHTSEKTTDWFDEHDIIVLDWPAQSPDMNPIENIWAVLKKKIRLREPENLEELENCLIDEWKNFDQSVFQNCCMSMPRRIEMLIASKGGKTKF